MYLAGEAEHNGAGEGHELLDELAVRDGRRHGDAVELHHVVAHFHPLQAAMTRCRQAWCQRGAGRDRRGGVVRHPAWAKCARNGSHGAQPTNPPTNQPTNYSIMEATVSLMASSEKRANVNQTARKARTCSAPEPSGSTWVTTRPLPVP